MRLALPTMQKTPNKLIFLDKGYKCSYQGKVDIILSPSLYWVKKERIPVRFEYQIKPLLKALFDEMLPEDRDFEYSYTKIKEGEYFIYAYNIKEITQAITDAGITLSNVGSLYFAQNELFGYFDTNLKESEALCIDGEFCITKNHDTLIRVPAIMAVSKFEIETILDKIELSNSKIKLKGYSNNFDGALLFRASLVVILFALGLIIESIHINTQVELLELAKEKQSIKNHLPSTSIQLNSIVKKESKSDKIQMKLRKAFYTISQLKTTPQELQKIEYTQSKIVITAIGKHLVKDLQKEFKNIKVEDKNATTIIRIPL